jgi:F-type H+-transporting ATPase subunit epsilon
MNLKVMLPTKILIEEEASKVTAEAENGSFTILPRHIDFVATLIPGILSFEGRTGGEQFVAMDRGVLVKKGDEVLVSALNAVKGDSLGVLEKTLEEEFEVLDEHQKKAQTALAKLETDFMRRFLELTER